VLAINLLGPASAFVKMMGRGLDRRPNVLVRLSKEQLLLQFSFSPT